MADGALTLCFEFETDGSEIQGCLETAGIGCRDESAPDVNARPPLRICMKLPLAYDPANQYFSYHDPQARLTADWQLSGDPLGMLSGVLRDKINPEAEAKVAARFVSGDVKGSIEFQLNSLIRNHLLQGGRITSASIEPDRIVLEIEKP